MLHPLTTRKRSLRASLLSLTAAVHSYIFILRADVPTSYDGVPAGAVEMTCPRIHPEGVHPRAVQRLFLVPDDIGDGGFLLGDAYLGAPATISFAYSSPERHGACRRQLHCEVDGTCSPHNNSAYGEL